MDGEAENKQSCTRGELSGCERGVLCARRSAQDLHVAEANLDVVQVCDMAPLPCT
jgi:hypothetical protein